jgi:D-mannonate dehydratase
MDIDKLKKEIREHWFKNHKAELTQHGELQVLRWKQPDTNCYAIRYVFDGHRMYITGDLGEAVFCLTWQANVHSFDIGLHYFDEKMKAYHSDRKEFDSEKAVKRLREWLNELKENDVKYDHDNMRELFEETRNCNQNWEWIETLHRHENWICKLDCDYWEWMYSIGDEYPARFVSYLVGLQMASEQLKAQEIVA